MKIKLIHWDQEQCKEKARLLESIGNEVDAESMRDKGTFKRIKEYPPDVFVIDLSRLPSHGREIAIGLRNIRSTRNIPIIFTEGETDKVDKIKLLLPDSVFCRWKTIRSSLKKAASQKQSAKIVPLSMMDRYTNTPLVGKLGIKENYKIALINSPKNFKNKLTGLPSNVEIFADLKSDRDIILWFVQSKKEFDTGLISILKSVKNNMLWIATPKKSSGVVTDINQNIIRRIGLNEGLVDFKICSIDEKWSGLLFKRRKK